MQQRAKPRNDGLDDFPTPPWAVRAFLHHVLAGIAQEDAYDLNELRVWEPACNRGYMARPLAEAFGETLATDVSHYGWTGQQAQLDFLMPGLETTVAPDCDWIITNPPFRLGADFIHRCLQLQPRFGFALLVRAAFLEGGERFETIFSKTPPSIIAQYAERVPMVEGRYDPKASTATAYAWLVWRSHAPRAGTEFVWIPPCKAKFYRPTDADFETREA